MSIRLRFLESKGMTQQPLHSDGNIYSVKKETRKQPSPLAGGAAASNFSDNSLGTEAALKTK